MTGPAAAGDALERRAACALEAAQRLLGEPQGDPAPSAAALRAAALALAGVLSADGGGDPWRQVAALHDHQLAIVRHRFARRAAALERIRAAVAGLHAIGAPAELLARAPAALCAASDLDRAVLSRVRDGRLVAEAVHVDGDAAGAAAARAALARDPPLVEADVLRGRRAQLVHDAPAPPLGLTDHVAAPLAVGERVVGVLHAGRAPGSRPVDTLDRDTVWSFSLGLAEAYETATLRQALQREREELRRLLEWLTARAGELGEAAVDLVAAAPAEPEPPAGEAPGEGGVLHGLLTPRELDVVRLMARGRTNAVIAGELALAAGTVKFHVNNILRKLRAANRAEAVSRYLHMTTTPR